MSVVEPVYANLLKNLQAFPNLQEDERRLLLRECSIYMGANFMKALEILDHYSSKKLSIVEYPMYYVLTYEKQRFALFKSRMALLDNDTHRIFELKIQCSCEESWNRKIGKRAPLFCQHQIIIYLIQATKHYDVPIKKGLTENMDDLGELLLFLK